MALSGDIIEHPVTGERFTFLETGEDTGGEYSRIEARVSAHGFVAAPHIHPLTEETFEIRAGTWAFVVDGEERRVGPGEKASIRAGTPHAWWNAGEDEGVAIVEFRPALEAEEFFESFFGLARDGKVSQKTGLPNLLWMALILRHYRDFVHLARPPLLVQRAVFTPLAAVARLLGYGMPYPYPYGRPHGAKPPALADRRTNPGGERSEA